MVSEDEIRSAMKQVEDPELGVNIVDLGLLYGVNIDDEGNVILDMTLTSMGCPSPRDPGRLAGGPGAAGRRRPAWTSTGCGTRRGRRTR